MAESHFDRRRREWKAYVQASWAAVRGLPAMFVVITALAVLMFAQHSRRGGTVRQRYLEAVQQAAQAEDWDFVETLARKLIHLRPADPVGQYFLALSAEANGQTERAIHLMSKIAPRDQRGFAPAHWWLARTLSTRHSDLNHRNALHVRDHLRQFLKTQERHSDARLLLAQTELAIGNLDEAVRQMEVASDENPELKLTAARFAFRLGRPETARIQAEQAAQHYRRRLRENPADVEARLNSADTLTMLGETEQAARVLNTGFEVTHDRRLLSGFVELCSNTFDILNESHAPGDVVAPKQLSLVKQSLRLAPQSRPILKRLAQLTTQETTVSREAAQLLEPYLTQQTAPAVVHFVLGTAAISRKQYETARVHFDRAHQLDSTYPACMNNLAWTLAHSERPDLNRALSLAEQATSQEPGRPEFHDTRGQILVKLGRIEEAVPELLQGLHTTGDASATHARLADAYDALGQPALASYHRDQKIPPVGTTDSVKEANGL